MATAATYSSRRDGGEGGDGHDECGLTKWMTPSRNMTSSMSSSSLELVELLHQRIAVASFFAALRGCVRPSAYLMQI